MVIAGTQKTLSAVIQLTHPSSIKAYTDSPLEASDHRAQLVPRPWPDSGVLLQQSLSVSQPGSSLFQWEMSVYILMGSGIWQKYNSLGLTFSKRSAVPKPFPTGGQSHVCFVQFVVISVLVTCPAFAILVYEKWSYCELCLVLVNVLVHLLPDAAPFPALTLRTMCPQVFCTTQS